MCIHSFAPHPHFFVRCRSRSFYQLDDLLAEFESRSTATTKAVVLVISGENDRTGEMMSPKKALKAIRKRVNPSLIERLGVVQLSEEYESRLRLYYPPLVDFSFRNYWFNAIDAKLEKKKKKGKLNQEAMIHWFPLGHTHKFQSLAAEPTSASDPQQSQQLLPATQREYFCSFVGSVNDWKPSRIEMIQELSNTMIIDHRTGQEVRCFIENTGYEFAGGRNKSEYSKLLHETAISLCPAGTNPEQFRIWESLEAGAIPILTKGETFSKLPPGHPLIIVDNWNGIAGLLSDFASDPDKLLAKQQETRSWWLKFKEEIKNKFRDAIG
eukprot:GEZU01025102.1.p1 GENE.GEZU01025102.1~~GEZU01025102.1.p1  ORF type:complete len:325 (-),score=81.61 GEZU01025102.1:132-1106(-)